MGNANSGRRPQPTELKMLRGNPGQGKLNRDEPKVPEGAVRAPDTLSVAAQVVWAALSPVCLQMGTLTAADVPAFAKLCELEATAQGASAQKDQPGFSLFLLTTMVDSAGNEHVNVKVHPAIKLEGETAVKLRPYFDYFGMTPTGRARLVVPKRDEAPVSKWAGVLT